MREGCERRAAPNRIRCSGHCSPLQESPCSPTVLGNPGNRETAGEGASMNNVYLLFPELLLLLVPLLVLFFWRGRASGLNGVVRVLVLLLVALIAAVPLAPVGGQGVDVVVVADLSRSMPEGSRQRELEIVKLLESRRAKGDRVGIVTYGRDARIERLPEELG